MRINLLPIRKIVEDITMRDTCRITFDEERTGDDTWDEETGTYLPPEDDEDLVYEGKCSVYPFSGVVQDSESGGEQILETRYWLGVPMSEEFTAPVESIVTITDVDPDQGDPEMIDRQFIVDDQEWQTMASSRRIKMRSLRVKP